MNPFQAIMGQMMGTPARPQMPQGNGMDWNAMMGQLQANPGAMLEKAGYKVPAEAMGNPQAMVMHLMQSGQIAPQMMQRIAPMLNMMGVR